MPSIRQEEQMRVTQLWGNEADRSLLALMMFECGEEEGLIGISAGDGSHCGSHGGRQ